MNPLRAGRKARYDGGMTRATAAKPRLPLPHAELLVPPRRPHYFAGRLLTAEDFALEQEYHIRMRRLQNLATLGAGVVSGLTVSTDPVGSGVIVAPGYAIDPLGREIIVPHPVKVSRPTKTRKPARRWFVLLHYAEEEVLPTPLPGQTEGETPMLNTTVRETFELTIEANAPAPDSAAIVLRMLTPPTKRRLRRAAE